MLYMCHENGKEDPRNTVALVVCAFERADAPEEFARVLLRLKGRDVTEETALPGVAQ